MTDTPAAVLADLEQAGLALSVLDGNLRLEGPREAMTPELVARLKAAKPELTAHLESIEDAFALTPLQRAYLLGRSDLLEIGDVANQVYHEIEGAWDLDRLRRALHGLARSHSALRLSVLDDRRQAETATLPELAVTDLRALAPDERERRRREIRERRSHLRLPAAGPCSTPRSASSKTTGWSCASTTTGWPSTASACSCCSTNGTAATNPTTRTRRRAWTSATTSMLSRHWPTPPSATAPATTGAPASTSSLRAAAAGRHRPVRHRRHPRRTAPSAARRRHLDATSAPDQGRRTDPSAALLAAWAETLSHWGAGDEFTLNTTVSQRRPIHPDAFAAIGQFSDPLLVAVALDRTRTFAERAREIQKRLRADLDHRHYSGIDVMRDLARHHSDARRAAMPYTFNSTLDAIGGVDGSALEAFGHEVFTVSQTPQVHLDVFVLQQHGELVVRLDAVEDLYPPGLLDALTAGLDTLLRRLCEESAWEQTGFDLLPAGQRAAREHANDTAAPFEPAMLTDAFVRHARRRPDAPAIITSRGRTTYGDLLGRASAAAHWLRGNGTGRGHLVGLVMRRGPEQIAGILGTLLAGAAYIPIDADQPAARRDRLLRDGRVAHVLTNTDVELDLPSLDLREAPGLAEPRSSPTPTPATSPTSSTPPARPATPRASWSPTATSPTSSRTAPSASASAPTTASSPSAPSTSTCRSGTSSAR
ncbi:hypothetical protein GCM10029992_25130 [Glycomyces albus]